MPYDIEIATEIRRELGIHTLPRGLTFTEFEDYLDRLAYERHEDATDE